MTAPTVVHCVVRIDNGETVCVRSSNALAWFWIGSKTEKYRVEERVAISREQYDALLRDKARLDALSAWMIAKDGAGTEANDGWLMRDAGKFIARTYTHEDVVTDTLPELIDALPSAAAGVDNG